MKQFKIGVMVDSFRLPFEEGVKAAAKLGAEGLQLYATTGEMAPENLSPARRREILDIVRSNGLCFSALCGDFGGHGFMDPEENKWKIEKSKRVLELALDLDCNVVTTHIGVLPTDKTVARYGIMQEACEELANFGRSIGAYFAVETGPETSAVLGDFLDGLSAKNVGVNLDPANLVMVTGDDPVKAVHRLKDYIVHTHAKDGKMLYWENPEAVYGLIEKPKEHTGSSYLEVPLGQGSVDFPAYLNALREIGYNGFLTIEREVGDSPAKDIGDAVTFLRGLIG